MTQSSPTGPLIGDLLPQLIVDLDRTAILSGAIASQDFEDVHHDPSRAQGRGMRDIFLSINTTNGYVDRYITDWAGPTGRITSVALRLGVPLYAGETLVFSGEVIERAGDIVTVTVVGEKIGGAHVRATVILDVSGRWGSV